MHFKYIKSIFLTVLVFCTWSAMASETGKQVHYASGVINAAPLNGAIDDQSLSQPFLLHQTSEWVNQAKSLLKNYVNINDAHVILDISALSDYAYGKSDNHSKAFYKVLLFPFHGFW